MDGSTKKAARGGLEYFMSHAVVSITAEMNHRAQCKHQFVSG